MMSTARFLRGFANCQCKYMLSAVTCKSVPSMASVLSKDISTSSISRANQQIQESSDSSNLSSDILRADTSLTDFYKRKLPNCCTSFCSNEGKNIFKEALLSGYMDSYFHLAAQFRTQEEPAYCGLSTLVMVLNTLEVDPKKVWKGPWRWYHEDMLDCCIPLDIIEKKGITMDQFACLAACNMLQVKMVHVEEGSSENHFRELVKSVTKRSEQVLVTSYSRITLEQTGDGHFSPIGGYNPDRDMVLIMDTARFKYPPHWVSLSLLYKAMQVIDPTTNLPRGYFLLSKNQFNPGLLFRLSSFFSPLSKYGELVAFFNAWEELLATGLSRCDMVGSDVAEATLVEVLRLLSEIKNIEATLLTVQFNSSILEEDNHGCYSQHIMQMINSLEHLPFYAIVRSETSQVDHDVMAHAGVLTDIKSLSEIGHFPQSDELFASLKSVTPVHFLTMFVLSWPYQGCRRMTFGSHLHEYTSSQLSNSFCFELQRECARIRLQLDSVMGYIMNCSKFSCCFESNTCMSK